MKAIVFTVQGGPDVLKYTDAPDPAIRPNEVLVRVKACALNHLDLWVRQGIPGVPIPLPHIPGSDISGEIAQTGADVSTVRVGQSSSRHWLAAASAQLA
jgi:NADPH:quinone reductase-like Zn-dependent oxidoreductase